MRCPWCGEDGTRVSDSRVLPGGTEIRRRRRCTACGERFNTRERLEEARPRVVKRSGARVPFDSDRVRAGILRALEKRPVAPATVERVVARIQRRLPYGAGREVSSVEIGRWVMEELRGLDRIAYLRFASVHQRFEEVAEFQAELERLEREPDPVQSRDQLTLLLDQRDRRG